MNDLRIAIVAPRFAPFTGGMEEYCLGIARGFSHRGHQVTVLTTVPLSSRYPFHQRCGFDILRFRESLPFVDHFSISLLMNLVKDRKKYDVIIGNTYSSVLSPLVALCRHPRFVLKPNFHGFVGQTTIRHAVHRIYRPFGRLALLSARLVICNGRFERSILITSFPASAEKCVVLRHPSSRVDCDSKARPRNKIITVSRLERYKGVHHLIKCLLLLPEYELDIVGNGPDRLHLEFLAKRLRVNARVRFHGFVDEMEKARLLCSSSVFALLSEQEAFGIVVAEALSAKLPCVLLNTQALSDWVDGKNCIGVEPPVDYVALANTIRKVEGIEPSVQLKSWEDHVEEL